MFSFILSFLGCQAVLGVLQCKGGDLIRYLFFFAGVAYRAFPALWFPTRLMYYSSQYSSGYKPERPVGNYYYHQRVGVRATLGETKMGNNTGP